MASGAYIFGVKTVYRFGAPADNDTSDAHYFDETCNCAQCWEVIEEEVEMGLRCDHGVIRPYISDPRDGPDSGIVTDIECPKCQDDFGPAYFPGWKDILEREY